MKSNTLTAYICWRIWTFTFWTTSQAINPCGDPPTGSCLVTCFNNCKDLHSSGSGVTDETIATEKNLCDSKCYGSMYNPSKDLGDGSFIHNPGYSANEQCMGICAYPAPQYCLEGIKLGYISQFFYCDCHTCCLQNQDRDAKVKCAEACHLWFMKQWSPKRNESCRFRPSYSLTKTEWCSAYCAWQITTSPARITGSMNINDIITNPQKPCVRKCSSLITSGVRVDYDTRTICTTPFRCVTAHVKKFLITTTLGSGAWNTFLVDHMLSGQPYYYANNNKTRTVKTKWEFFHTWRHAVKMSIPRALINMREMGINITMEPGRDLLELANSLPKRDKRIIEELLRKSYRSGTAWMTKQTEETVILEKYPVNYTFITTPCAQQNYSITRKVVTNMPVNYEVYIRLSDPTGGLPFTGLNMSTLVAQTPQFSGLNSVREFDDTTLEVMWSGSMVLTFMTKQSITWRGRCEPIPGCSTFSRQPPCKSQNNLTPGYDEFYYGETF